MKFLHLSGTAREIGQQHGEQARDEIHISLESYERLFYEWGKYTWKQATEQAKTYIDYIEQVDLDFLEEMEGLAKGAGVEFADILSLNARSEIALTLPGTLGGCTSVAVLPPFSDRTYLAQNWDWRSAQYDATVAMKIEQAGKPTLQMVTEAGMIGKIGLNDAGLGVCLNAIRARVAKSYLPLHLGLRLVLNSSHLEEAVAGVSENRIASAANFLIAQDNGQDAARAINMEVSPFGNDAKETRDRYLYHTNHLCSQSIIDQIGPSRLSTTKNTYLRFDRMKEMLQEQEEKGKAASQADLLRWLSDHKNSPFSICRHQEADLSPYTDTITVFSVIMDLAAREILFLDGQPCQPVLEKTLTI